MCGRSSRRLLSQDDLVISELENILVIDNGCDQTIININSFLIHSFAGTKYKINGALNAMSSSSLELVSEAFTLVTIDEDTKYIFKINQAFLDRDPTQSESLTQPHQMRAFGVIVDDCAKSHLGPTNLPGGQCISN